jgi:hypothetical protein
LEIPFLSFSISSDVDGDSGDVEVARKEAIFQFWYNNRKRTPIDDWGQIEVQGKLLYYLLKGSLWN